MPDATTLTNLLIWDGEKLLDADTLQIRDNTISFIGDAADVTGAKIDCSGLTALPG